MSLRSVVRSGGASSLAALAACSLFVDTSGLDTTTSSGDGGVNASNETAFCESHGDASVFCDDFDQPGRMAMSDTGWSPAGSPLATIDSTLYASPGRSCRLTFGTDAGPTRTGSTRVIAFPLAATRLTLHAKLHFASSFAGRILAITYSNCSLLYTASGTFQPSCPPMAGVVAQPLPSDKWSSVALGVERISDGLRLIVTTGEEGNAVTSQKDYALPNLAPGNSATVLLGNLANDLQAQVNVDDVLIEVQ